MVPLGAAGDKTREILWDTPAWAEVVWYALAAVSILVFAYGVARRVARYRAGRPGGFGTRAQVLGRIRGSAQQLLSGRTIAERRAAVGLAHRATLYGFVVLFIGTVVLAVNTDFTEPLLGWRFFEGNFYLAYSLLLDVFGLLLLVGLGFFAVRRLRDPVVQPSRERSIAVADWTFLASLLFLVVTGFILEGLRIEMDRPAYPEFSPVGWATAQCIGLLGLSGYGLGTIRHVVWWTHGFASLTVVAAIPFTKASHMLASGASLLVRRLDARRTLDPGPDALGDEPFGYGRIADFTDLHLLQLDACTSCGKCHEACPAVVAESPLDPRDVILGLRDELSGAMQGIGPRGVLALAAHGAGGMGEGRPGEEPIADPRAGPGAIWSCMQCNACVAACPVGIEQAPMINQLRRHALELGEVDLGVQAALMAVQKSGNSFGESRRKRTRWTRGLEFEITDARTEPVELLWYVGDFAAFDARAQATSRALARLLHDAGVSFGIMHEAERTAGNDIRRVGEEALFEELATENVAALDACEFDRILTTDPHTLNTLRNDYPHFGGSWEVVHHTSVLRELLAAGRVSGAGALSYRVTYHDPCHLGRMNGEYDDPRAVLGLLGCELIEMPRNCESSFCCGAGGGQIWMSEPAGTVRPSEDRIHEALALCELDYFLVSCPKDVVMYEDAIKTVGEGRIELRELTELVEEAATPVCQRGRRANLSSNPARG